MCNQTKDNNLNYLIDPTFTNVNRLFVLTFKNEDDRTSFSKYYVPKVEIKDFNLLIGGKPFFEIPVKNKEEAYEAIIEMSKNNDYATGDLLNYEYFKDHYKLIAIDLSKQIEFENLDFKQKVNFIGRLEENNATIFFIAPFTRCATHINDEHVETAENLDIIIPMYNLIEHSDNYADSSGSLYQFKRDESPMNNAGNPSNVALDNSTSLKSKTSLLGKADDDDGNDRSLKNTKIVVPLKYLSIFLGH